MPFTEYFTDGFDCSASVVVASMFNNYGDKAASTPAFVDNSNCILELDPIILDMTEFRELFYPTASGAFTINSGLRNAGVASFNEQTISDEDGTHSFNLIDYVLSCYENQLKVSRTNFNHIHLIELEKDLAKYRSLFEIHGSSYALSWPETLAILEQLGALQNPDESILLKVAFNYVNDNFGTNMPVQIIFNYKVMNFFPNYWQYRAGIPKQKIHPRNPLRIAPQFIRRADGTIMTSGYGFPENSNTYSIWNKDGWGQATIDGSTQESALLSEYKKAERKEALADLLDAMLEDPIAGLSNHTPY